MVNLVREVSSPRSDAGVRGQAAVPGTSFGASLAGRFAAYWMVIAALLAVGNASISIVLTAGFLTETDRAGVRFNLLAFALALALSIGIGIARPAWWRRAIAILAIGPVPVLLVTSGNLAAGGATLLLTFVASWLGRELARKALGQLDLITGWVVGATFGLGLIAVYGFTVGMLGILRAYVTWPLLAVCGLALVVKARAPLRREARALGLWLARPTMHRPLHTVLAGAALACLWLNLIGALAPEIRPDAVRQRLAVAAQFARNGNLAPTDPDLFVATAPALGETIYAAVLTISPLQGAKLLHFLAGILCAGAVFALGRCLGGPFAGGLGAFAFYSTVMTAYLSQTAYLDLFIALFGVTAALLLVLRRAPGWHAAIAAGVCIGLAVAAKAHFGYVAIGLGITAGLMALRRRGFRHAIGIGAILIGASIVAATPWLARSYALTNAIAGLSIGTTAIASGANEQASVLLDLKTYGFGRSIGDLLALPLTATLTSRAFGGGQLDTGVLGGHIGYLLLTLLPLLLVAGKRWRALTLLIGAAVAALLWFYTAQYLRYALPLLAILSAVGGMAYVGALQRLGSPRTRAVLHALLCIVALSGVGVRAQMPDNARQFAFGLQDREAYLDDHLARAGAGSYANLRLVNGDPSATRILAMYDGARLYSRAQISTPFTSGSDLNVVGPDDLVLQRLRAGGYSYIMVDRSIWAGPTLGWERIRVVNEDFLRRHTQLLGGGDYSYLYRILPPGQDGPVAWARGSELLIDGDFESAEAGLASWTVTGTPLHDRSGGESHTGEGAIQLGLQDQLAATVAVRPGVSYLLSSAARSVGGYAYTQLLIEWRDSTGKVIAVSGENTPASASEYHAFSILADAPAGANTATVSIRVLGRPAWIDDLSLRSVPADGAVAEATTGDGRVP